MAGPVIHDFASRPWADQAACKGMDPALFHPIPPTDAAEPKRICSGCPVKPLCLDFATETRQEHGVWGGLDEDERRKLRRPRRRRAAG